MRRSRQIACAVRATVRRLDPEVGDGRLNIVLTVVAAVFFAYVVLCVKAVATGTEYYRFGDFYALWCSAFVTDEGAPAVNYDADALHLRQVALGLPANADNPFPYPPTFLLILAPFGRLGLVAAYVLFMSGAFAGYLWAAVGGRWRDWPRLAGALGAPATGITVISGQTGFLSGALMLGGLRLAQSRPIVAGALFGLLAFKPQLGVLVPVALIAAGLWRTIAAAGATVLACVLVSTAAFGANIWRLWVDSLLSYSGRFDAVDHLMPTIAANARMLGAPGPLALAVQALVAVAVAVVVWRAFRRGVSPRAGALLLVGTFLATPHALNYDLPMTTVAVLWYLEGRIGATRSLRLSEIVVLTLALVLPFAMLALGAQAPPISWAPELALFGLIAASNAPLAEETPNLRSAGAGRANAAEAGPPRIAG